MPQDWYTIVKELAPYATAVIALIGVLATIIFNARKARALEADKLEMQRRSLKNALVAELSENAKIVNEAIEHMRKTKEMLEQIKAPADTQGSVEFAKYSYSTLVYCEAVKQIGILQADVVTKVAAAYSESENLTPKILFLFNPEVPFYEAMEGTKTSIPYSEADQAMKAYVSLRNTMSEAIKALSDSPKGGPRTRAIVWTLGIIIILLLAIILLMWPIS